MGLYHTFKLLNDEAKVGVLVATAKREIRADIKNHIVPETVTRFAELHDYVDANEYGGLCDPDIFQTTFGTEVPDKVQDALDEWLQEGRP